MGVRRTVRKVKKIRILGSLMVLFFPVAMILGLLVACNPESIMGEQCSDMLNSNNVEAADVSHISDAQWDMVRTIVDLNPDVDPWLAAVAVTAALEGSYLATPPSGVNILVDPFTGNMTHESLEGLTTKFYEDAKKVEDYREMHGDELAVAVTGGDRKEAERYWALGATITASVVGIGADYLIQQRISDPMCEHRGTAIWLDTGDVVVIIDGWVRPVAAASIWTRISSQMGWRKDPFTGEWKYHAGTDFPADCGTPIWAMADGIVTRRKEGVGGYGNYIDILHDNGWTTRYAHMESWGMFVDSGDPVIAGQPIGEVGNAGRSTGCHLHLEMRDPDGILFNAADLFGDAATTHEPELTPPPAYQ